MVEVHDAGIQKGLMSKLVFSCFACFECLSACLSERATCPNSSSAEKPNRAGKETRIDIRDVWALCTGTGRSYGATRSHPLPPYAAATKSPVLTYRMLLRQDLYLQPRWLDMFEKRMRPPLLLTTRPLALCDVSVVFWTGSFSLVTI
eukprot:3877620-Rhodomonas_salina.2